MGYLRNTKPLYIIPVWCNGNTGISKILNGGSIPSTGANYFRRLAQFGRASGLGPGCRQFESVISDQSWGCSSVGRATALHAVGRRFDSVHLHQLWSCSSIGRASPCHGEGSEIETRQDRQSLRAISSVGRASALQAEGRWFETNIAHQVSMAAVA